MSDRIDRMLPWAMSTSLQSAAVLLLFTAATSTVAPQKVRQLITIFDPQIASYEPKVAAPSHGGGGGGDRSLLRASKGELPKRSPRQFTPPMAVRLNEHPILAMEPSIVAPPDVPMPQVNMQQFGDPLGRLGPASNGQGKNGGIGDLGDGGGVGNHRGPGAGRDDDWGIDGMIFRAGVGGVSAPYLLYKVEPEYSEEARKAKYQGTVLLSIVVDGSGRAQHIQVARSLGLGLDEKAMEAVRKWKFRPAYKDGRPVTVSATVEVNFRLL